MPSDSYHKHRNAQTNSHHKSHKHKDPSKNTGSSTSRSNAPDPTNISFLFVVNEFDIDFETAPVADLWLNYLPPTSPAFYRGEYPGTVFSYRSGTVTPAANYVWDRSHMGQEGHISYVDPTTGFIVAPEPYRTETIFSCSAHLPLITLQSDASLGSYHRSNCRNNCDAVYQDGDVLPWNMLHFTHPQHLPGVSMANSGQTGSTYVAGKNARWMPALVPKVFENTERHLQQQSRGLGGDLPVVIGLMAFHASRTGNASAVFEKGWWQNGRWRGPAEAPKGYPETPFSNPRGFLVQISADLSGDDLAAIQMDYGYMETVTESIYRGLEYLEGNGILVEG
ncbi:hypothetical protein QBC34DRAFT_476384 [Podospora aff. communis PSN243]|uniref:Uncharacterized protein n=1 Tax=Podospora aff. communis PSN243 TaxID=3040156 RepID=A0AAV9G4V5_9PEZI|nr:hypothetical protein QBC34DRAFT_476384 [Podospora aff. communis PSN243]